MEIHIKTIPHSKQRYETPGDYWYDSEGVLQIRISDLGNDKYEMFIALHELIEERLTKWRGLTEPEIMEFDVFYEQRRKMGFVPVDAEPGFDLNAPYLKEHTISTGIEMLFCAMAGEKWPEYENAVNSLEYVER